MSRNVIALDSAPPESAYRPTNLVDPGDLISGTPNDRGVTQFTSDDGTLTAGTWACDTYHETVPRYPSDELCVVLEGSVTVTEHGGEAITFGPGDAFVIRAGTTCDWDAHGPFRKLFMEYDPSSRPR